MTAERFRTLSCELFGFWGSQREMARRLNTSQPIVRRWCMGEAPIPQEAIDLLLRESKRKIAELAKLAIAG